MRKLPLTVRIEPELKQTLEALAKRQQRTVTALLEWWITKQGIEAGILPLGWQKPARTKKDPEP